MAEVLTTPSMLAARRLDAGDADCLVVDDARLTYAEVDRRSALVARLLLDSEVSFGARIGVLIGNTPEFLVTWSAITRIGAVAVPISTLSTPREIRRIATHANLHALVAATSYRHHSLIDRVTAAFDLRPGSAAPLHLRAAPTLRRIWTWGGTAPPWAEPLDQLTTPDTDESLVAAIGASVTAADVASIIYTSGSTADPKGVIHTHGSLFRAAAKSRDSYDVRPDDRLFTQMPFFWVGGLTVNLLASMSAGATLVTCSSSVAAEVLAFLERERATNVMAWPHLARGIAADPTFPQRDLSSIRVGSLWEALPEDRRPLDPSLMVPALGMTETAGPHTIASLTPVTEDHRGSFGPPQPGMSHRIVDVPSGRAVPDGEIGELLVRGDTLAAGLVRQERHETFDDDGWYPTGDLVSRRLGHLHFHGRVDDLIKTAGANVSPREVEDCLLDLPDVVAATVTAVPDRRQGVTVGAAVVSTDRALLADDVRAAMRTTLSAYKVPKVVVVLHPDDVPLMSSGKVDRRRLLRMLQDEAEPAGTRKEPSQR